MKYRVHLYRTYRDAYAVDAESSKEALSKVIADPASFEQVDHDFAEETSQNVLVDQLLLDGEVDYDASVWFDLDELEKENLK